MTFLLFVFYAVMWPVVLLGWAVSRLILWACRELG